MGHANHFLREIGRRERQRFKESIISTRVAAATEKGYKDYMRHLKQQERTVQAQEAVARGQRGARLPMSHAEQFALNEQQHLRFAELPESERLKLEQEQQAMWGQIPEHLQDKAKKLAGR
jgi:hypothetical protein